MDLQPVKGTRDFFPEQMRQRNWLFDVWRKVSLQSGFQEYDTCVLEHEELYIRKAGDEISQQLYSFEDKSGRRLSLRPEMTPSLARMILQHQRSLPMPVRWFSIPQCFRYESIGGWKTIGPASAKTADAGESSSPMMESSPGVN